MTFPTAAKLAGTFSLESSPGTSLETKAINFSQAGYVNCKLELADVITSTEMTSSSYDSYKSIFSKINNLMYKNTLYSIANAEEMQCRIVNNIELWNNEVNAESGYIPYSINAYFTRGFNSTTPTTQYGYNSGYYANVYMYSNGNTFTPINSSLSGTITSFTSNKIVLNFTTHGFGSGVYGYVFDLPVLNLRLSLNSPLTYSDMLLVKGGGDYTSVKAKINDKFSGKIIKVFIEATQEYEEMLIIDVDQIIVTDENQLCPNDSGYMPNRIDFNVTRAYNGTTSVGNSPSVSYINITKPSGLSFYGSQINAYIDGNQDITDTFTETYALSNDILAKGSFTEILEQNLGISSNQFDYGTIRLFVDENIIFSDLLYDLTIKEFIIMINDIIAISSNSYQKYEYLTIIEDLIRVYDQSNLLDFVDYYANIQEFLKFSDNVTLDTANKILNIIVNEYFRVLGENNTAFVEFYERAIDFIKFQQSTGISGDLLIQISDTFDLSDNIHNLIDIKIIVNEILKSTFILNIDGEDYECYAVNLDNKSLTRYTNYNFNSYAHFNNKYYALGDNGLYDLLHLGEDGEELESKIKTSFLNISDTGVNILGGLGSMQKSLNTGYFVIKNDGQVGLRIYTDTNDKFDYILKQEYNDTKFRGTFGKRVQGTCFQLELTVFSDFELEQCEFIPIIGSKRV